MKLSLKGKSCEIQTQGCAMDLFFNEVELSSFNLNNNHKEKITWSHSQMPVA